MFGIMGVVNGLMMAKAEHEAFEKYVASMPQELREDARKKHEEQRREEREERRHREIVEATRNRNRGPLAFLLGFIIGHT